MKKHYSFRQLNLFSLITFMVIMVGFQMGAFAQSSTDCISGAQPVRTYIFFLTNDNGTTYDTVSVKNVKDGEMLTQPEFVGMEYSTFKSWYTVSDPSLFSDNTYKFDESNFTTPQTVTATDTVKLYASLTLNVFHVIFMEGVESDARVFRVWEREAGTPNLNPDDEQVVVDATTRSVGWYYDQALTQRATTFTMPAHDTTLYPDIQSGYWVNYASNGGTYVEPDFYQFEETTQIPDNPTRVGYTFDGWDNGTDAWYRTDGSVNQFGGLLTASIDLTAVWTPNNVNYTVVYWVENADDENYSVNNVRIATALAGTHITTLASEYTAANATNIVDGMYQHVTTFSYDKTTQANSTDVTVAGDGSTVINLYFKRRTYTLTFNPNRVYNSVIFTATDFANWYPTQANEVITAKYGANIWNKFPINRHYGYDGLLIHWTYETSMWRATNANVYSYALQLISTMPGSDVTFYLYANFTGGNEDANTIYYDFENIEGTGFERQTVPTYFRYITYGEEYCDVQGFTRQSETEAGFNTSTHRKDFDSQGKVTLLYYRNSYDIRFFNGGTELTSMVKTRKYEQMIGTLPELPDSVAPAGKKGFSFGGWYANELCEGDPIDTTSTMPAAEILLYAKWIAPDYTVRIHHTTVGVGEYTDITVPYGQTVPGEDLESIHPCYGGANAYGWKILNDDGSMSAFATDMQIYRDLALVPFCLLTGEQFTITYNMNCAGVTPVVDDRTYADGANPMVLAPSQNTCGDNIFLGWLDANDILHYPGNGIYMTEDKTLTALWGSGTEHTEVVMVENHPTTGTQTATLDIVTNGTTQLNLPENFERPERPNDLFIGWSVNENAATPEYAPGESVLLTCNVSLYPVWMQIVPNTPTRSFCEGVDIDLNTLISYTLQNDAYTFGTAENIQTSTWEVTKDGAEFTEYTGLVIANAQAGTYEVNLTLTTTKGVTYTMTNTFGVVSGQFDPVFTDLPLTYCEGEHDALPTTSSAVEASGSTPAIPAVAGAWKLNDAGVFVDITAVPSEVGDYNLMFVPDAGQCANNVNFVVTVVTTPTVSITGDNTFCAGGNTELQAVVDASVSVEQYQWLQDEVEISSATNQTYNVSAAGDYKVEVTTTEGCIVTSAAFAVSEIAVPVITVSTRNAQQTILYGQSIETITLNCANGSLNTPTSTPDWITLQPNATGTEITINGTSTTTGTYSLVFTGTNACPVEAEQEVIITVNPDTVTVYIEGNTDVVTYDGMFHDVMGFTFTSDNPSYLETDFIYNGNVWVQGDTVGEYPMNLDPASFENYNSNFYVIFNVERDGKLTITRAAMTVTVTGHTDSKVYNGSAQSVTGYDLSCTDALYDATLVSFSGDSLATGTDVGTYMMGLESSQFSYGNTNIEANFEVTDGWLKIVSPTLTTITITANSDNKEYDGTALTNNSYTYSTLATGDYIESITVTGSQTVVGTSDNVPSAAVIKNAADEDVTASYDITYVNGILEVTAKALTITAGSDAKIYDGTALTANSYINTALASSDHIESVTVTGSQTVVGTSDNIPSDAVIKNIAGDDVTFCYNITYANGTLEVTQKDITITANSDSKVYDGTALTANTYTNTPLADGDNIESITVTGSQTLVGTCDNIPSNAVIKNIAGDDVTFCYNITYANGTLEVTQKDITITANSDSKVYDGTALTANTYTNTPLADGDNIESITVTGSQTLVGTCDNIPSNAVIKNIAGDDVTFCYNITYENGTLEVTEKSLTITASSDDKVYDGTPLSNDGYGYSALATGDRIESVMVTGSQTVVGSSDNMTSDAVIKNTTGDDVTFCYNITYANGMLEVTEKSLTITASSDDKVYDGTPLSNDGYGYSALATGDRIESVMVTGSQTVVGSSDNMTSDAVIKNTTGDDVTFCYNITYENGTLEVTAREVTVSVEDKTVAFNGSEQYGNTEYTFNNLVSGHNATITYTPSHGTAASTTPYDNGEYSDDFMVMNGLTNVTSNYTLGTQTAGKLTITSPDVVIVTITGHCDTVPYDGAEHSVSGYDVSISNPLYTETDFEYEYSTLIMETNAGTYNMGLNATVFENLNTSFNVTFNVVKDGNLTINPRTITLTSGDATREYNGNLLTNDEVTVGGDGFAEGEGATYNVTGQQRTPGSSENWFTYTLNEGTLAGNYIINTENGTLTVTNRTTPYEVTMTSKSNTTPFIYNGYEQTIDEFVTHTFTVDGNTYTVSGLTASGSGVFADTYENAISGTAVVTDEYGNVVTDQFNVNTVPGTLTISKRTIIFTIENPEDATKVYDGTPLEITFDKLHVGGRGLAETDELIDGILTSSSSEVGEYTIEEGNMFYMMAAGTFTKSGFKIKHSSGEIAKAMASYSASILISGSITAIECNGVTYQGHDYPAVQIGTQCWLAENLRNTATAAGPINSSGYAAYNDDPSNVDAFGYLYTWYSAVGVAENNNAEMPVTTTTTSGETYVQGICPPNWAVPSHEDFEILNNYASGESRRLRDMNPQYWIPGEAGVTPNYNFNSRAGGFYNSVSNQFERMLLEDYYWESNSTPGSTEVTSAASAYYCSEIPFLTSKKSDMRSVRCIRKQ